MAKQIDLTTHTATGESDKIIQMNMSKQTTINDCCIVDLRKLIH